MVARARPGSRPTRATVRTVGRARRAHQANDLDHHGFTHGLINFAGVGDEQCCQQEADEHEDGARRRPANEPRARCLRGERRGGVWDAGRSASRRATAPRRTADPLQTRIDGVVEPHGRGRGDQQQDGGPGRRAAPAAPAARRRSRPARAALVPSRLPRRRRWPARPRSGRGGEGGPGALALAALSARPVATPWTARAANSQTTDPANM